MMNKNDWWKDAVVYQIYPQSFKDSNNDVIKNGHVMKTARELFEELGYTYRIDKFGLIDCRTNINGGENEK